MPTERPHIDLDALYDALDQERSTRGLSWRDLGKQTGTSASTFTRLAQGRGTDANTFASLISWLGMSADAFVRGSKLSKGQPRTVAAISGYLRADRSLTREQSDALDTIVRSAYRALRSSK